MFYFNKYNEFINSLEYLEVKGYLKVEFESRKNVKKYAHTKINRHTDNEKEWKRMMKYMWKHGNIHGMCMKDRYMKLLCASCMPLSTFYYSGHKLFE